MEALIALAARAAAAGRWARDMLVLGVTTPLDHDAETRPRSDMDLFDVHPFTGLPMVIPGIDIHGTSEACATPAGELPEALCLTRALGDDD